MKGAYWTTVRLIPIDRVVCWSCVTGEPIRRDTRGNALCERCSS